MYSIRILSKTTFSFISLGAKKIKQSHFKCLSKGLKTEKMLSPFSRHLFSAGKAYYKSTGEKNCK